MSGVTRYANTQIAISSTPASGADSAALKTSFEGLTWTNFDEAIFEGPMFEEKVGSEEREALQGYFVKWLTTLNADSIDLVFKFSDTDPGQVVAVGKTNTDTVCALRWTLPTGGVSYANVKLSGGKTPKGATSSDVIERMFTAHAQYAGSGYVLYVAP